ncbi:MAG: cytochrome c [Verrucomicrobiota bacterium]
MPDASPSSSPAHSTLRPDQGELHDVTEIHAALLREQPEPRDGFEPVNLWLVALTGGLLFWGGYYLANFSGRFEGNEYSEYPHGPSTAVAAPETPEQKLARLGAQVFNNCVPCHQATGEGVPGQFPPLAGSDWVNVDGNARIIRIVLNGLSGPVTVNGGAFNNAMNQFKDLLSDNEVAAVLTYVRNSWGNKGGSVTPDEVKAIRAEVAARDVAWTADELLKIPTKGGAAPAAAPAAAPGVDQLKEFLKALPPDQMKSVLDAVKPK